MILAFRMFSFKSFFSLSSFTFIKRLFSSSVPSAIRVVSSASLESNIVRFAGPCCPECPCLCVTAVSLTAVPSQEALSLFSSNPTLLIPLPAPNTDAQFSCHHSTGSRAPLPCFGLTGFFWPLMSPAVMGQVHVAVCGMDGPLSSWAGIQQVTDANGVICSPAAQRRKICMGDLGAGDRRFSGHA